MAHPTKKHMKEHEKKEMPAKGAKGMKEHEKKEMPKMAKKKAK
jgi:hypothetical protein